MRLHDVGDVARRMVEHDEKYTEKYLEDTQLQMMNTEMEVEAEKEHMEKCVGCSHFITQDYTYCPHCGAKQKKNCPHCKKAYNMSWNICPYCGKKDRVRKKAEKGDVTDEANDSPSEAEEPATTDDTQ